MVRWGSEAPLSAARNMVRALREGGFFPAKPPVSPVRGILSVILAGLVFGALVYLLGVFAVPQLLKLGQHAPPPAHFVRPAG